MPVFTFIFTDECINRDRRCKYGLFPKLYSYAVNDLHKAKFALKLDISRRILAGEEGFEPSAYGFGDRRSTS